MSLWSDIYSSPVVPGLRPRKDLAVTGDRDRSADHMACLGEIRPAVWLVGPPGSGKTTLLKAWSTSVRTVDMDVFGDKRAAPDEPEGLDFEWIVDMKRLYGDLRSGKSLTIYGGISSNWRIVAQISWTLVVILSPRSSLVSERLTQRGSPIDRKLADLFQDENYYHRESFLQPEVTLPDRGVLRVLYNDAFDAGDLLSRIMILISRRSTKHQEINYGAE